MNLNKLARQITIDEGLKKSVNIAQVKEIIKITLKALAWEDPDDVMRTLSRYKEI